MSSFDRVLPVVRAPTVARQVIYRHRLSTRIWHWLNAAVILVMLMSGLMIFNAYSRLDWGQYGANPDYSWLQIGDRGEQGYLRVGEHTIRTTGFLGAWGRTRRSDGIYRFPWLAHHTVNLRPRTGAPLAPDLCVAVRDGDRRLLDLRSRQPAHLARLASQQGRTDPASSPGRP